MQQVANNQKAALDRIGAIIADREKLEGAPTFVCPECHDTGWFITARRCRLGYDATCGYRCESIQCQLRRRRICEGFNHTTQPLDADLPL